MKHQGGLLNNIQEGSQEKRYDLGSEPPVALAVHCLDPVFRKAFDEFIKDQLAGKNYAAIVLGGGIHSVGVRSQYPGSFDSLNDQIDFVLNEMNLRQAIIINHEGCRWYHHHRECNRHLSETQQLLNDLRTTRELLSVRHPNVQIRTFQAQLDKKRVYFKNIV